MNYYNYRQSVMNVQSCLKKYSKATFKNSDVPHVKEQMQLAKWVCIRGCKLIFTAMVPMLEAKCDIL